MEHLRLMLAVMPSVRPRSDGGEWQEDSGLGLYRGLEDAVSPGAQGSAGGPVLQQKMSALENIVCVLNREMERAALTLEALGRQHRLDQEKIENLTGKVRPLVERPVQRSGIKKKMNSIEGTTNEQMRNFTVERSDLLSCTYKTAPSSGCKRNTDVFVDLCRCVSWNEPSP